MLLARLMIKASDFRFVVEISRHLMPQNVLNKRLN